MILPALSPARGFLSPSKQRTSSRRSSSRSPRKVAVTGLPEFSCKDVSFTPQRIQQPPRAWERRPATPFVPRHDEKQKIWKRVPLGELGIDANRITGVARCEPGKTKEYVRIVKKLKIGHDGGEDDKENVAVASMVQNEQHELGHTRKTYVMSEQSFVASRTEEDTICGSPKKKLRFAQSTDAAEEGEEQASAKPEAEDMPSVFVATGHIDTDDEHHGDFESNDPATELENDSVEHPAVSPKKERAISDSDGDLERMARLDDEMADQRSSSPPTILAENITVDEFAARESSGLVLAAEDDNQTARDRAAMGQDSCSGQDVTRRISLDEAAFLRDFMTRTKAERMAREQALIDISTPECVVATESLPTTTSDIPESDVLNVARDPDADTAEVSGTTSPLRRSKRAVVTSIPRPQSAPNTIQLKRATGSEFIFTANNAHAAASVGITTRTNTKKNKGSALNVSFRLEQLLAQKAQEEVDVSKEQTTGDLKDKSSRKRRQGTNKARKVLRWNDSNLFSYQEAQVHPSDEIEEIEDSSQEAIMERDTQEPTKVVKLTLTVKSNDDKDEQLGLRRVRRGLVGSVNGTPAPKTRTRGHIEALHSATSEQADKSYNIAESVSDMTRGPSEKVPSRLLSNTRRSRMPIPAASKRATSLANAPKSADLVSVTTKGKEGNDSSGRRRLRVRP